jgi:acyl carrier protein
MRDAVDSLAKQTANKESPAAGCARIFRDIADLTNSKKHFAWSEERLLQEPLEALEVDSLTLLEYVMAVEEAFNVELDENEVNACGNVADLVQLVETALNGPKSL